MLSMKEMQNINFQFLIQRETTNQERIGGVFRYSSKKNCFHLIV